MTKKHGHKKQDEEFEGEQETQEQGSSWEEPEQEEEQAPLAEEAPPAEEEQGVLLKGDEPEVMPMAASAAFYITFSMTYPAGATQIGQATTYQIITPWGQSTPCYNILDAMNQMVAAGSMASGQMWNYLNNGVTRGLATGGGTVPTSATYFQQPP